MNNKIKILFGILLVQVLLMGCVQGPQDTSTSLDIQNPKIDKECEEQEIAAMMSLCYHQKAFKSNDVAYCYSMPKEFENPRTLCIAQLLNKCESFPTADYKFKCYMGRATYLGDPSGCEKLSDETSRKTCRYGYKMWRDTNENPD